MLAPINNDMQGFDNVPEQISFHSEGTDFALPQQALIEQWIQQTAKQEGKDIAHLNIIFCNDEYLYQMNMQYLQHDTLTDVITFQYSDPDAVAIEGDIFISVERTQDNASTFGVPPLQELHRVIIHGSLHLLGYKDKSPEDKKKMTSKEDEYLQLLQQLKKS